MLGTNKMLVSNCTALKSVWGLTLVQSLTDLFPYFTGNTDIPGRTIVSSHRQESLVFMLTLGPGQCVTWHNEQKASEEGQGRSKRGLFLAILFSLFHSAPGSFPWSQNMQITQHKLWLCPTLRAQNYSLLFSHWSLLTSQAFGKLSVIEEKTIEIFHLI